MQDRIAIWPQSLACTLPSIWYGQKMVLVVRSWLTHSVLSTAPALVHDATPFSSSSPTVFSHSRRPFSEVVRSRTFVFDSPACVTALRTLLLNVGTTVLLAQSASRF